MEEKELVRKREELGSLIRLARRRQKPKVRLQDVGESIGKSKQWIQHLEAGNYPISIETLYIISKKLGISLIELIKPYL